MGSVAAILQLVNLALPEIGSLIVMIKGKNGGTSAVVYLDEADVQFASNQQQIADWLKAHNLKPAS